MALKLFLTLEGILSSTDRPEGPTTDLSFSGAFLTETNRSDISGGPITFQLLYSDTLSILRARVEDRFTALYHQQFPNSTEQIHVVWLDDRGLL